ncbi:dihydrofolate reductase family protein [Actinomadura fibrosa]|uniref:Dihydrofolate reductase family protein n=1 Tax=Actinomadura fibrosa TaxID=111802 RepID=A0ABW2XWA5_9ACTN|nr:dihydrofolate reductase family protein [Actinomadura fibrosa]
MAAGRPFTASVFIATSLDGYIARADGDIEWLTSRGEKAGDTGYDDFAAGVDTLVIGRGTYEKVLTFGEWPYEGKRVAVLSTRLPEDADPRVTVHRDLGALMRDLTGHGARRVYVDGGQVIQAFLRAGLLDDLTITTVPVLLGGGLPLFGALDGDVGLVHRSTRVLGAGLVQSSYTVEGTAAGAGA